MDNTFSIFSLHLCASFSLHTWGGEGRRRKGGEHVQQFNRIQWGVADNHKQLLYLAMWPAV